VDADAHVRSLFSVQAQPRLRVKGHDAGLLTYLVPDAVVDPGRAVRRGIEGLATPMIGCVAEQQCVIAAHGQACGQCALRAVTVLADAGVGKTRLRHELRSRLWLASADANLLEARADPDSALQPYGLLRQLLARPLTIADDLAALAVLSDGIDEASAAADPWPPLGTRALLRCHAILAPTGDAEAVPLLAELRRQSPVELAQLPDAAELRRLVKDLPRWREAALRCTSEVA